MVLMSESKDRPRGRDRKVSLVMTWPLTVLLTSMRGVWPMTVTCSSIVASSRVTFRAKVWDSSRMMPLRIRVLKP